MKRPEAPRRESAAESRSPLLSVIVPVRDDIDRLHELIRRLEAQTLRTDRFEVVIGDDGSAPGSLARFDSYGGWLRVIPGPAQTSYAARNRAARSALGGVLAFCDSDCLPERSWLEEGLAALEHADVVAGEVTFIAPQHPTVWSLLMMDMFLDQDQAVRLSRAVTANLLVSRRLFEELGGFDETLPSGGDFDFVRRAVGEGAELAYAPKAVVRHPTLDDGRTFLRKVWASNRWSAVRHARAGERPDYLGLTVFVPVLGVALARRLALRPAWRLYRRRLEAAGVTPSKRDELRALPLLYFVVSYVAGLGRLRGWLEGRRLRSTGVNEPWSG